MESSGDSKVPRQQPSNQGDRWLEVPDASQAGISEMFEAANSAHHEYERKHPDHEWQDWYGPEMHRRGYRILPVSGGPPVDTEKMSTLLKDAADEQARVGDTGPWADFYVRHWKSRGYRVVKV